jgi:hypothetical protein
MHSEEQSLATAGRWSLLRSLAGVCRYAIGAVFVLSAALKALDPGDFALQVSYYGIGRTPYLAPAPETQ